MAKKTRGTPREGDLLLQGIAYCARCGHKMFVRYKGGGQYVCNHLRTQQGLPACQTVRASTIDAAVGQAFLAAVAPAEIDALGRAHRMRRKAEDAALAAARQQVERKRYQAALAQRQYDKVDPDNRLVAAELERRWEVALTELRGAEATLAQPEAATVVSAGPNPDLRGKVVSLAGRLPALWSDPATGDDRRKALLRCLVEKVVLERGTHDVAQLRVVWRGGAVSELSVLRLVTGIDDLTRGAEMRERILELARVEMPDDEIAATLTREGHRSPTCPHRVLSVTVQRIRLAAGLKMKAQRTRWRRPAGVLGGDSHGRAPRHPVQVALRPDPRQPHPDRPPAQWGLPLRRHPRGRRRAPQPPRARHRTRRSAGTSTCPGGASPCMIEGGHRLAPSALGRAACAGGVRSAPSGASSVPNPFVLLATRAAIW